MKSNFDQLQREKGVKEKRTVTQEEVAEFVGITPQAIIAWKRGSLKTLSVDKLSRLCEYFDCNIGDLYYFEDTSG